MKEYASKSGGRGDRVDINFLERVVKTLWERSGKEVKGKELIPKAVVHIGKSHSTK